ncbi:carboxylesterase family protein [Streptococcus anginosus]|nr:carboxylesterase family protein [Streptococcus anginosus]
MELLKTKIGNFYYKIIEKKDDNNIYQILSIPYAKADRLEHPMKIDRKKSKGGIVNKKESLCFPQKKHPFWMKYITKHFMLRDEFQPINDIHTEDAFVVNIWADSNFSNKKPVLVFIHGGGEGSGTVPLYKMDNLAKKEIVCVSITYRVGNFGYMPSFDDDTIGSLAYLDQQKALEWIKENIEEFGGDKDNITLMGHCGGAIAALYHYINPTSNKLFNKLILCAGNVPILSDIEKAKADYKKVLSKNKVKNKDELKSIDQKKFMKIKGGQNDIVDGKFFTVNPLNLLERGEFPSMPVLIGSNKDEFSMIEYPMYYKFMGITKKEEKLDEVLREKYGDLSTDLKEELASEAKDILDLQIQIMELLVFHSSAYYLMEEIKKNSRVYGYRLNYAPNICERRLGAYHGAELVYFFDNMDKMNVEITKEDRENIINSQMDFVEFIKTGKISNFNTYNENGQIIEYDKVKRQIDFPHKELVRKVIKSGIADRLRKEYISNRR